MHLSLRLLVLVLGLIFSSGHGIVGTAVRVAHGVIVLQVSIIGREYGRLRLIILAKLQLNFTHCQRIHVLIRGRRL